MRIKTRVTENQTALEAVKNYDPDLFAELAKKRAKIVKRIRNDFKAGKLNEEEAANMLKRAESTGPGSFLHEIKNEVRRGGFITFDLIVK